MIRNDHRVRRRHAKHTRAIVAASAYALVTGKKIAGMYDHAAGRHLRIAAEAWGEHLQGYDGDRDPRFGGTLPELRAAGDGASVHMVVEGQQRPAAFRHDVWRAWARHRLADFSSIPGTRSRKDAYDGLGFVDFGVRTRGGN